MAAGWGKYDPAPIETFHSEALKSFHEVASNDHSNTERIFGVKVKTVDGIAFSSLIAEFKTKIMKEYGISSDPTLKDNKENK